MVLRASLAPFGETPPMCSSSWEQESVTEGQTATVCGNHRTVLSASRIDVLQS